MAVNFLHKRSNTANKRPTAANLDVGEFFYLALFWSYPGVEDGESLLQDFLGHVSSLELNFKDVCVVFYFDDVFYV